MTKPHVHAELIKAWADGAEIEWWGLNEWRPVGPEPKWSPIVQYRVKPDSHAEFKAALARGERVDMRVKGQPPGVGWFEVLPSFDFKAAPSMEFRIALPWQDERDACDRGETIQILDRPGGWRDMQAPPNWLDGCEYRVKPKTITETFHVGALMQWSPEPHDGIALKPSPFHLPTIALDISYAGGEVTNITLKDWKP